jgi:hypothetical protein
MKRHAYVEDGKLVIGKMSYSTVVLPTNYIMLLPSTEELLE